MRASPAFQFELHRFDVWRSAVLALAVLGVSTLGAWWLAHERPVGVVVTTATALAGFAVVWLAAALANVPARILRWDGQLWHIGRPGSAPDESVPGELGAAIDLGAWMLLRFRPAVPDRREPVIWLPVQRRGLEPHWHALRCAVYSPHPPVPTDISSGP